jgi:hypothetical protein
MMKTKVEIITLCFILLNTVIITCVLNDSSKASVEMNVTAKVSSAIQVPFWIVHRFSMINRLAFFEKF